MSIQSILYRKGEEIVTIAPSASIKSAAQKLRERDIPALVVKDGDSVLGIVSDREIVSALARSGEKIASMTVGDIAARDVPVVSPEDGLKRSMAIMNRYHRRHLFVVRDNRLAGVVSMGEVLKHRLEDLETEKQFLSHHAAHDAPNSSLDAEARHV